MSKSCILLMAALSLTLAALADDPDLSVLRFTNGDLLHGELVRATPDEGVQLRRADCEGELRFTNLSGLSGIRFPAPVATGGTESRVALTNGDEVRCNLVSVDAEHVVVDTSYGGRLQFLRPMVEWIAPNTESAATFVGPKGMDGWSKGGNWEYARGNFTGQGYIGREIDLPKVARISFVVEAKAFQPYFMVTFGRDKPDQSNQDALMLRMNGNNLYLQRHSRKAGHAQLGRMNVPHTQLQRRLEFDWLINRETGSGAVIMNGQPVLTYVDPQNWVPSGKCLVFSATHSQFPMQFGSLQIAPWDGRLPSLSENNERPAADAIEFANGDRISGELLSLADGVLSFRTQYATLKVPLARIERLDLGAENSARARRNERDVQLYFPDGSHFTVQLQEVGAEVIVGQSENCGQVELRREAFAGIRFNIYEETVDGGEGEEELLELILDRQMGAIRQSKGSAAGHAQVQVIHQLAPQGNAVIHLQPLDGIHLPLDGAVQRLRQ